MSGLSSLLHSTCLPQGDLSSPMATSQRGGLFPDSAWGRWGHSLEVVTSRFQEGRRLIGHRPHHNGRVILVPTHQLLHYLQVVLQRHIVVALAVGQRKKGACHGLPG